MLIAMIDKFYLMSNLIIIYMAVKFVLVVFIMKDLIAKSLVISSCMWTISRLAIVFDNFGFRVVTSFENAMTVEKASVIIVSILIIIVYTKDLVIRVDSFIVADEVFITMIAINA
jgi:hypothetical protein